MNIPFVLCDRCGKPIEDYFRKIHINYAYQDKKIELVLCGSCTNKWNEVLDEFRTATVRARKLSRMDLADYVVEQFHSEESKNESP